MFLSSEISGEKRKEFEEAAIVAAAIDAVGAAVVVAVTVDLHLSTGTGGDGSTEGF